MKCHVVCKLLKYCKIIKFIYVIFLSSWLPLENSLLVNFSNNTDTFKRGSKI